MSPTLTSSRHLPRLILHFDVNKTLIMHDSAGSRTTSDILKQSIMQSIMGTMKEHPNKILLTNSPKPQTDSIVDSEPFVEQLSPQTEEHLLVQNWIEHVHDSSIAAYEHHRHYEHDIEHPQYMSLDTYVHEYLFPYRSDYPSGTPTEHILRERQAAKRARKHVTKKFIKNYYKHHKDAYDKLITSLTYDNTHNVFILPAFFNLMLWLERHNRSYSIVFRTFGDISDIDAITREFNLFCSGEHPHFPHDIQSLRSKRIDLTDKDSFGYFHRNDEQTTLVLGEYNQPKDIDTTFPSHNDHSLHSVIRGEKNIYEYLMHATQNGKTIALRDFYPYWSWKGETPIAGKVFLIDLQETEVLQIFFDDNISIPGPQGRGIVDLRDAMTHKHLEPQDAYEGLYLKHVSPVESIPDHNYFIKAVQNAEKRFTERKPVKASML